MLAVAVLLAGVNSFTVFGPAETAFLVDFDEVGLAFFAGEIANALAV